MRLPRIVITLGDPAGIGPEIVAAAVASRRVRACCMPIVVGDERLRGDHGGAFRFPGAAFVNVTAPGIARVRAGSVSAVAGEAAYRWVCAAADLVASGAADALATAPLSKEALRRAGHRFAGHTELLAALTRAPAPAMLMCAGPLTAVMVTRHLPLAQVPAALSSAGIVAATRVAVRFLADHARLCRPRIAVCALNPHAGEGGLLGSEERRVIMPAVRVLRRAHPSTDGPLPADAAWRRAATGACDLVVAMYHDQVMVPLKVLAPRRIVNVTAGLPFVRTSPGHGTAFDIAGRSRPDPEPMIEAIVAAARLAR